MTRYSALLTRERLLEVLSFDAETGMFTSLITKGRRKAGEISGCVGEQGYRWIGIDGQIYRAHRLVWLLVHGEWPLLNIDHKDGNRDNNIPSNLRLATTAENAWNTSAPKNNTSGHKGVFFLRGKWMALIQKNRKRQYLGLFSRFEDACAAYDRAAISSHGEFARL
jgi:HNH endonuclease